MFRNVVHILYFLCLYINNIVYFGNNDYRLRGFAGALGGRLGYNGLPSVFSGLDESDSGARKSYPFELEKAIHNVMFIQHHIQRQDQFNAVCITERFLEFKHYQLEAWPLIPDQNKPSSELNIHYPNVIRFLIQNVKNK